LSVVVGSVVGVVEQVFERMAVPADLAERPPGPALASALAGIDRSRVNGYDLVVVLRAQARQVAHEQARLLADLVEVAHCAPGGPDAAVARTATPGEFAADEIRAALGWTRRAAEAQLGLAMAVVRRLPTVGQALSRGSIDLPRARVLCEGVSALPDEQATACVATAIDGAPALTTGQLAARLRALAIRVDPAAAARRYQRGLLDRRVTGDLLPDGTAWLSGEHLPADVAATARARIDTLARVAKIAGDERSLDQLRADIYLGLLTGTQAPGGEDERDRRDGARESTRRRSDRVSLELTVPLTTLMELSDEPGRLGAWGPVVADVARRVAADNPDGTWRYAVTDDAGQVVSHGTTRRRPTVEQANRVTARDRTCRAPGCRVPAAHADIDHTRDYAQGGPTAVENMAVLCRHDHRMKHEGGWRVRQVGSGGLSWTSPLGHTYVTAPEPVPP
jgi:hypothetical protein